jgi:hypothetical protein
MPYPPYPREPAAVLTNPNRLIYRVCCPLPPHHQFIKVNRSRLAFFVAGSCVFAGVSAGTCGLRYLAGLPVPGPILLSPAPSSLASSRVKTLKSASTEISVVTDQWLTRGLFKRLDGVIAKAEEITNPGLTFGSKRAAYQLLRARYGRLCSVWKVAKHLRLEVLCIHPGVCRGLHYRGIGIKHVTTRDLITVPQ